MANMKLKKGQAPDFTPTKGALVSMPAAELHWGKTSGRASTYDALLEQLVAAKDAKTVLCFETTKPRPNIGARAKKLGIRVEMAEHGGKLYVRYMGLAPDSERWKRKLSEEIIDIAQVQPRTPIQMAVEMRKRGFEIEAGSIDARCKQMENSGLMHRKSDGSWEAVTK